MPPFRIIKAAPGADGPTWAAALADGRWRSEARLLKRDGPTSVYLARLLNLDVVVKCLEMGAKARLQALFGGTRGLRHWRGAALLRRHGIPTAPTIILLRSLQTPRTIETLVMKALPGKTVLRHLADRDLSVRQEHAVARALGALVAATTAAGLFNRDFKPSNLIVTDPGPSSAAVAVIDCVDIRRRPDSDRMRATLVIETIGVGLRPRRSLMMGVVREAARRQSQGQGESESEWVREAWQAVGRLVAAHGDPTPRVNPLSPS